jgi:hypothetical protein
MGSRKQTTVNLTKKAQEVKDKLYPAIDLKGLLSASIVCFEKSVPDKDKIAYVNKVLADDIVSGAEGDSKGRKRSRGRQSPKSA